MASSGKLVRDTAEALPMSLASVSSTMQALRQEEMVSMRGRGTSAASMTSEDAVTLLVALASNAVYSQVLPATKVLKAMPLRASILDSRFDGRPAATDDRTLGTVLVGLLENSNTHDGVRIEIGTNTERGGYAIVYRTSAAGERGFVYSTFPLKTGANVPDPLTMFEGGPSFFTTAQFDGRVLTAMKASVDEPVLRSRLRVKRSTWSTLNTDDSETDLAETSRPPGFR